MRWVRITRLRIRALRLAIVPLTIGVMSLAAACGASDSDAPTQPVGALPTVTPGVEVAGGPADHRPQAGHPAGQVDPNAPVTLVIATEFGFDPAVIHARRGEPLTVRLQNRGALEHDFSVEGLEQLGAAHAMPGGEASNTFESRASGVYNFFCAVAGHREAGMTGKIMVEE